MAVGYYSFGLGIIAGVFSISLIRGLVSSKRWDGVKNNTKKSVPYFLPIFIIMTSIYLVVFDHREFFHPPKFTTLQGYERIFLANQANEIVLMLAGFVSAVGALSFLIRIPFSNWQQIKVLGLFEATRIREVAKDEMAIQEALNEHRTMLLHILSANSGYELVRENVDQGTIALGSILPELTDLIEKTYTNQDVGFSVRAGFYHDADASDAPIPQNVVLNFEPGKPIALKYDGWESQIFTKFTVGDVACVLWSKSIDYVFLESDRFFFNAIQQILLNQIDLFYLRESALLSAETS